MFGLINKTDVTLKCLFINDVKIESYHDAVSMGGAVRVYKGKYKGQQVALKVLDKEVGIVIFSLFRFQHYRSERVCARKNSVGKL
jgi:hypothetical protein